MHRCGRAGRKQSRNAGESPPTVFSFFTREFFAMASSVVDLLKACNAWIDPNLLALTVADEKLTKDTGKQTKRKCSAVDTAKADGLQDYNYDSDNDQFAFLGRSVLKRASHVSDAEYSTDSDTEKDHKTIQ